MLKERITVIGNWSSFEGCTKELPEEKIILCPGAINADKNQSLLVDAFAAVADEFPDWQVHIYGRGKQKDEAVLLKRIEFKRLTNRILLKGYADLSEPYAKCAFVVFPSKTEGFPLTVIDAAMFAKPTLMIHDWIGCGKVVESKNFAGAMRRLMADSEYRKLIGVQSKEYCEKNYSRSYILDKWESIIKVNTIP